MLKRILKRSHLSIHKNRFAFASAKLEKFNFEDGLNINSLLTEEEKMVIKVYCF